MSNSFATEGTTPQTDAPALPSLLLSSSQQYSNIPFLGMSSLDKKKEKRKKKSLVIFKVGEIQLRIRHASPHETQKSEHFFL